MRRSEKAVRVGEILDELYPEPPIPLDHHDAYTLLVAVTLSAQTTDRKVNEVTPALFERAGTPHAMATLPPEEILGFIRQLGLAPTKAKNLHLQARQLVDRHAGEVPGTFEELEALAGVGHKTASVVMSQWFEEPAFPVDTHIHRLARRWGLTRSNNVAGTERDLKKVFPRETWNRRHIQIVLFGREHCPARHHDLLACRICSWTATKKQIRAEMGRDAI